MLSKEEFNRLSKEIQGEDFGIYKDVTPTDEKYGNHRLYEATCSKCGRTVKRVLYDLRHFNTICQHGSPKKHDHSGYTVYGIKCFNSLGIDPGLNDYNKRVYDMWRHMILRTAPEYWKKEPTYTGTTVCEEWKDFSIFYNDIKELEGYDYWKDNYGKRVMLDKDLKGHGKKLYSKETCCFLGHKASNQEVAKRYPDLLYDEVFNQLRKKNKLTQGKRVKATNLETKEITYFYSTHDAAKFVNGSQRSVWQCLSNDPKYIDKTTYKGFEFVEVTEEEFQANKDKVVYFAETFTLE